MPDEIFKIRSIVKKIGALSPAGRTYLIERLKEDKDTTPVADAVSTSD
jgi:hypothetical protein